MKSYFYVSVIIVALFITVNGQTPQSPCPGTFDYESDGRNVYGVIRILPRVRVTSVRVKVKFTVAAQVSPNYIGRLTPVGKNDLNQDPNSGEPFVYRLDFPLPSPLPKLTELNVNGKVLCYNEPDSQSLSVITTVTLEHTTYISEYGSSGFPPITNFIENPQYQPDNSYIETVPQYNIPQFTSVGPENTPPLKPIRPQNTQWIAPIRTQDIPSLTPIRPQTPPTPEPLLQTPPSLYNNFGRDPTPIPGSDFSAPVPPTPYMQELREPSSTQFECGRPTAINVPLILGGESFIRGTYPWLVSVSEKKRGSKFVCAGNLVSDHHVVTAGHCITLMGQERDVNSLVVTVGAFDLDKSGDEIAKKINIEKAIHPEGFDSFNLKNDIAVLILTTKVTFNDYIIPICLWDENLADLSQIVDRIGVVAGWGTSEKNEAGHGKPRKAKVPIVSTERCRKSHKGFSKRTSDTTICAGYRNGTSPCSGDSGGGLYLKYKGVNEVEDEAWRLRGVISLALLNEDEDNQYDCNTQEYVIFTDAAKFTPWIKNVIQTT
ncbi:hypothetical protein K1T71_011381 [Dendrolimus kikuchii]|uniref:Uncharacterized protein n=1 Tax=Dendrolimus kikuchii TaxID=765133 RepID=A0ACC1CNP8_9NEOP|nr:hypothetical protein K1T71_011381 [Dendrolimus kikuchii]